MTKNLTEEVEKFMELVSTYESLTKKLMEAVNTYESATDARIRYRAESQICRIADRLRHGFTEVGAIFGDNGAYIPEVERFEKYRVPQLETVLTRDSLNPVELELKARHPHLNPHFVFMPGIQTDLYCEISPQNARIKLVLG